MTFLEPLLLFALPLAALPVIIHLIHLHRRRQVKWAAMMFLRMAQRMNKGLSRLRQILILALRVLAVAALLFVITRPLAGGWLGLTGGPPDTVMVLLDRSASMEQQGLTGSASKRSAALSNAATAIRDAVGTRSRLVLIDSATKKPQQLRSADALLDLPQTGPTDTAADIPSLVQAALDHITINKTGRTDVWLLSDLQQSDWDAGSGRWEALRRTFATLRGVRFHLLCYPEAATEDWSIVIPRVSRRETGDRAELLFDIRINRQAANPQPVEVPLRFIVNGASSTMNVAMKDAQLVIQGHTLPIDKTAKRGWGRVELPADTYPANNAFHFVFDEPAQLRSVIVSEDDGEAHTLAAALAAPADSSRKYAAMVLSPSRAAEIPWEDTALIVWQAPVPAADEPVARQLQAHAAAGRALLFLPPASPDRHEIFGLGWEQWQAASPNQTFSIEWWRNDSDLLANTRDGTALPVGMLEIVRRCGITGAAVPLARYEDKTALLVRAQVEQSTGVYFLGTLPGPGASSLARDGVVMFAMLHRALNEGARSLGKAQYRFAAANAFAAGAPVVWRAVNPRASAVLSEDLPLRAGVVGAGDRLIALNRPPGEDLMQAVTETTLNELFAGLDFRVLTENLEEGRRLTNEIWRTFLIAMAVALLAEALLCMPQRREPSSVVSST